MTVCCLIMRVMIVCWCLLKCLLFNVGSLLLVIVFVGVLAPNWVIVAVCFFLNRPHVGVSTVLRGWDGGSASELAEDKLITS